MHVYRTGDRVWIAIEGRERRFAAVVTLASDNGRSLMVEFDAMVAAHAGMMPLLWSDEAARFESLFGEVPITLAPREPDA